MLCVAYHMKGGVGKTLIALSVAAMAAAAGAKVCVLEIGAPASASSWSRIRKEEDLTPSFPVFSLQKVTVNVIEELSNEYDLIIVDVSARSYHLASVCVSLSDLVLIPCGPDQQEIESTLNVFSDLQRLESGHNTGSIPARVVLTRVSTNPRSKTTADLREYFSAERIPVLRSHISIRQAWQEMGRTGMAIHELRGNARSIKAAAEMQEFFDEIVELASVASA